MNQPEPFPIGTKYDGRTVTEIVRFDEGDKFQPYLYQLDDGYQAWIPVDYDPNTDSVNKEPKYLKNICAVCGELALGSHYHESIEE